MLDKVGMDLVQINFELLHASGNTLNIKSFPGLDNILELLMLKII